MGQAPERECSVIHISSCARFGRLAARIRRSDWLSVSLPAGGRKARPK